MNALRSHLTPLPETRTLFLSLGLVLIAGLLGCGHEESRPQGANVALLPASDLSESFGLDGIDQGNESYLTLAGQMGAKYLRVGFSWYEIQRNEGDPLDFTAADARVNSLIAQSSGHSFKILGLLGGSTPWAADCASLYPNFPDCPQDTNFPPSPAHINDYRNFVSQTVAHFKDRVQEWEVWNEANIGFRFWKPTIGGDPAAYGELLKAAYRGIKGDPNDPFDGVCEECTVLFGGVPLSGGYTFFYESIGLGVPGGLRFMDLVFQHHPDIIHYFDAMALHPYMYAFPAILLSPFTAPDEKTGMMGYDEQTGLYRTGDYLDIIRDTRSLLRKLGDGDKPIWITESGWPTDYQWIGLFLPRGVSFQEQAQYLARSFVLAFSEGVEKVIWWGFYDGPQWISWQEDSFGLIGDASNSEYPDQPKPSYQAYKTLTRQLADTHFVQDLRAILSLEAENEYGYLFSTETKDVTVLWRVQGERSINVPVRWPVNNVELISMDGQSLPVEAACSSLQCQVRNISISPSPVYLVQSFE